MNESVEKIISRYLLPRNEYIYGIAHLGNIFNPLFGKHRYAIVIGKKLNNLIINEITKYPTREYYKHYRRTNQELAFLSSEIAEDLGREGISVISIKPTISTAELDTLYSETLKAPFSHKMAATRAGLGWIGKSGLLITKEFGPRLRLVSLLTDLPIKAFRKPVTRSYCGSCKLCQDACPAKAITGKAWDISVEREDLLDPFRCREMCRIMGEKYIRADARVCGICIAVCPYGKMT